MTEILVVFTYKSANEIITKGFSDSWTVKAAHAAQCDYIVCTRNRKRPEASTLEEHGAAFLVGRISHIKPSSRKPKRYEIHFSEFAELTKQPIVWPGNRNPFMYVNSFAEIQIDPATLNWQPVTVTEEQPSAVAPAPSNRAKGLTIAAAKAGLATNYGVSPDNIEITIRT